MSDLVMSLEEETARLWRVARAARAVQTFDGPFHSTYHSELLVELDDALTAVWPNAPRPDGLLIDGTPVHKDSYHRGFRDGRRHGESE